MKARAAKKKRKPAWRAVAVGEAPDAGGIIRRPRTVLVDDHGRAFELVGHDPIAQLPDPPPVSAESDSTE